jgi:flagellar protein FliL
MKNNKLLVIMVAILITIVLLGGALFFVFSKMNKDGQTESAPTIDEIVLASVDVPEITTILADKKYVKIQFKIQTNSEDAAAELTKRDFQVNNLIIQELSEMTQEDLSGKAGKIALQQTLQLQINELMQDGEIQQVYITSYIIQ